jgi:hypothetical protein
MNLHDKSKLIDENTTETFTCDALGYSMTLGECWQSINELCEMSSNPIPVDKLTDEMCQEMVEIIGAVQTRRGERFQQDDIAIDWNNENLIMENFPLITNLSENGWS